MSNARHYHHVDVFTPTPYSGNSLAVFPDAAGLSAAQMLAITQELRHFETIFLETSPDGSGTIARVFDLVEELGFAGHPVIGAACVLHALHQPGDGGDWSLHLPARSVRVLTRRHPEGHFSAVLDQGRADFLHSADPALRTEIAAALDIAPDDLDPDLPPAVLSTGLRYLMVPVRSHALSRTRIGHRQVGDLLTRCRAQFIYALDAHNREGRHWSHSDGMEDVATGSAAGCVAAYLRKYDLIPADSDILLRQGQYAGRPSRITIAASGSGEDIPSVRVGGEVAPVGTGTLTTLPGERL